MVAQHTNSTDGLGLLLDIMPPPVREAIVAKPHYVELIEIVLDLGRPRIADRAEKILADPSIGQLFLGGGLEPPRAA